MAPGGEGGHERRAEVPEPKLLTDGLWRCVALELIILHEVSCNDQLYRCWQCLVPCAGWRGAKGTCELAMRKRSVGKLAEIWLHSTAG